MCYAYLSDVEGCPEVGVGYESAPGWPGLRNSFARSKWFTRGWTLQELLAPRWIEFLDYQWNEIGTKFGLEKQIEAITKISHLFDFQNACIAQKMSWASNRETTRIEDQAYCLMGVFGVNMPLLYGEGQNAFIRLQYEILSKSDDESIFAWSNLDEISLGLLASSPIYFADSSTVRQHEFFSRREPHALTNKGVELHIVVGQNEKRGPTNGPILATLNCINSSGQCVAFWMSPRNGSKYTRDGSLFFVSEESTRETGEHIVVWVEQDVLQLKTIDQDEWFHITFKLSWLQASGFDLTQRYIWPPSPHTRFADTESDDEIFLVVRKFDKIGSSFAALNFRHESGDYFAVLVGLAPVRCWVELLRYREKGQIRPVADIAREHGWPLSMDDKRTYQDIVSRDPPALGTSITARLKRVMNSGLPGYTVTIDVS